MATKKNTVRKKMTMRDYVTFVYFLETGERSIDLSEYDPDALDEAEVRVMCLTPEQKAELPNFIKDHIFGVSVRKLIASIPKINKGEN